MERSPETIDEWQEKGKYKIALEKLKSKRLSCALSCALSCKMGGRVDDIAQSDARKAIACSIGILNLLVKSQERG